MIGGIVSYVSNLLVVVRANCAPVCSVGYTENAEVLELLAFWKAEQQAAYRFGIWRPLFGT